jgi:hypothetical protein
MNYLKESKDKIIGNNNVNSGIIGKISSPRNIGK